MKKVYGLLLTCGLVPAMYGAAVYYLLTHNVEGGAAHVKAIRLAFLIGLPVATAGVVHWWDVWVKPLPKLGAFWAPVTPSRFVGESLVVHGGIIIVALIGQLVNEQRQEFGQPHYDFARAKARLAELDSRYRAATAHFEGLGGLAGFSTEMPLHDMTRDAAHQELGSARVKLEILREEIARETERAKLAKPNALGPLCFLLLGVLVTVFSSPMQANQYSGSPINDS